MTYTKDWFFDFFKRISDAGELGALTLENGCALWHIGVRTNKRGNYYFPTKETKTKFLALCAALGVEPYAENKKPNFKGVYEINDHGLLLKRLTPTPIKWLTVFE
jgi:hypothetical protein